MDIPGDIHVRALQGQSLRAAVVGPHSRTPIPQHVARRELGNLEASDSLVRLRSQDSPKVETRTISMDRNQAGSTGPMTRVMTRYVVITEFIWGLNMKELKA